MSANSYEKVTNILSFAVGFEPKSAFPLDVRSMFGSYDEAFAAAQTAENAGSTNTKYYIGQKITVYENGVVTHYSIEPDKTLKELGARVVGDDKTISVGDGGTIGLKAFGVEYYKYMEDTILEGEYTYPDAMPENPAEGDYVKIGDVYYQYKDAAWAVATTNPQTGGYYVLTQGWKSGLEPKAVTNSTGNGYELAWYEPSRITVEGLSSSMSSLQKDVEAIDTKVDSNKTAQDEALAEEVERATNAEGALSDRVTKTENDIKTLNADAQTEGSVDYKIAQVISTYLEGEGSEGLDTLKELVDWAENHATDVTQMNENINSNATAIKALEELVGTLPEGATATTVFGYIAEAVKAEETRAMAKEKELVDAIAEVKAVTDAYDPNAFATAEQGTKADTAVQSVVAGETNGHIAVDGQDVKVYELPVGSATNVGGVKADGATITIASDGTASVNAVPQAKVTGLSDTLEGVKTAAIAGAKENTDENAVLVQNIVTSANVAESAEAASSGKVVSEQLLLDMLSWKTSM